MIRVAITGAGVISCYGRGMEAITAAMREGRSGVALSYGIDITRTRCHISAQVPQGSLPAELPRGDRFAQLAVLASSDAVNASGFDSSKSAPTRFGAIIGTGLGGCETLDSGYKRFYGEKGRVAPLTIPHAMYNAATSAVAIAHGAQGPAYGVVSACASATHALGLAAQTIAMGQADVMLAGGADAPITAGIVAAWESMRVLSIDNDDPAGACRPFSADRKGLVLAEGAGVFVLESLDHARRRGAPILGEIVGFGASSDATHMTDPSADGAARAIRMAMSTAGGLPGYINAHGTGTRANDAVETEAIKRVFAADASSIAVSSTKSMHGHAMGASGAIELAATLGSLDAGFLPPTINLTKPDPECDLDYIPNTARAAKVSLFLSNSFGFGGMNAVLAVRLPS